LARMNSSINNNPNPTPTLERRVVAALADDTIEARTLAELITETDQAISDADTIADRLWRCALNPVLSHDAVKAHKAAEFAQFAAKRLRNVLPRLEQRHQRIIAEVRCTWRPR
jgi:hypothetical protein